ncbi:hypothetical protein [Actinophytocola sp. KF-1]
MTRSSGLAAASALAVRMLHSFDAAYAWKPAVKPPRPGRASASGSRSRGAAKALVLGSWVSLVVMTTVPVSRGSNSRSSR